METQMINQSLDGGSIPTPTLKFKYQYCKKCGVKKRRLQKGFCIDCWLGGEINATTDVSR